MTIVIGTLTVAFARQELRTLGGCTHILANLREEIETASQDSAESGTLQNWCDVLYVVNGVLNQAAQNLHGAIKLDEAPATPTEATAE